MRRDIVPSTLKVNYFEKVCLQGNLINHFSANTTHNCSRQPIYAQKPGFTNVFPATNLPATTTGCWPALPREPSAKKSAWRTKRYHAVQRNTITPRKSAGCPRKRDERSRPLTEPASMTSITWRTNALMIRKVAPPVIIRNTRDKIWVFPISKSLESPKKRCELKKASIWIFKKKPAIFKNRFEFSKKKKIAIYTNRFYFFEKTRHFYKPFLNFQKKKKYIFKNRFWILKNPANSIKRFWIWKKNPLILQTGFTFSKKKPPFLQTSFTFSKKTRHFYKPVLIFQKKSPFLQTGFEVLKNRQFYKPVLNFQKKVTIFANQFWIFKKSRHFYKPVLNLIKTHHFFQTGFTFSKNPAIFKKKPVLLFSSAKGDATELLHSFAAPTPTTLPSPCAGWVRTTTCRPVRQPWWPNPVLLTTKKPLASIVS